MIACFLKKLIMVTVVPTGPEVGEKPVIEGTCAGIVMVKTLLVKALRQ
jgi:hypothetical protein